MTSRFELRAIQAPSSPIQLSNTDELKEVFTCLYVVAWTVVYWVSEVVPLPVTALLPLILFPFFGVARGKDLAVLYFKVSSPAPRSRI